MTWGSRLWHREPPVGSSCVISFAPQHFRRVVARSPANCAGSCKGRCRQAKIHHLEVPTHGQEQVVRLRSRRAMPKVVERTDCGACVGACVHLRTIEAPPQQHKSALFWILGTLLSLLARHAPLSADQPCIYNRAASRLDWQIRDLFPTCF